MKNAIFAAVRRGLLLCGLSLAIGCGGKHAADNPKPVQETPALAQPAPAVHAEPAEELTEPKTVDLIQAASLGNVNDVKFYLRRNPEALHRPNNLGMYPIHLAARKGHGKALQILLQAGADVNAPNTKVKATPLQYAASEGHVEAAVVLLDAKANVNATDSAGRTPLMWAADKGQTLIVTLLLERGADANQETSGGWTALKYAEQGKHPAVVELLSKQAAKPVGP
jgi:ankyrin repeat protein